MTMFAIFVSYAPSMAGYKFSIPYGIVAVYDVCAALYFFSLQSYVAGTFLKCDTSSKGNYNRIC